MLQQERLEQRPSLQEERTIAENVGRGGARVMTTTSSLSIGDVVQIEEVGGPFKTRADVRGTFVGRDGIRRLNLRRAERSRRARPVGGGSYGSRTRTFNPGPRSAPALT